uniref:Large ribosomal subunit protein mL43 n=1 Tax=Zonotrichia albicollis TaxID=44394 RepID=A0A8D2MHG8_ZONAL
SPNRALADNRFALCLHQDSGRHTTPFKSPVMIQGSPLAPRQFVEEAAQDFARQHPDVVLYVSPHSGPGPAPVLRAEYLNGTVRDELIASKTSEEIMQLATKLANQSGLDIIRIRKPFHTDNPSVQGQWHPLTNKPSILTVQGPRLQPE